MNWVYEAKICMDFSGIFRIFWIFHGFFGFFWIFWVRNFKTFCLRVGKMASYVKEMIISGMADRHTLKKEQ